MANPTFMEIWSKDLILGDTKTGCLIQPLHSTFHWWRGEENLSHIFQRFHSKRNHEHSQPGEENSGGFAGEETMKVQKAKWSCCRAASGEKRNGTILV